MILILLNFVAYYLAESICQFWELSDRVLGVLSIGSCFQDRIILLFLSIFFLHCLLALRPRYWIRVNRVNTFVSFQILEKICILSISVFRLTKDSSYLYPLLYLDLYLLCPASSGLLSWRDVELQQSPFLERLLWFVIKLMCSIIYWFVCVPN